MKKKYSQILLCLTFLIASCTQEPADIVLHSTTSPAKKGFESKNPYKVTVKKGDTLYRIAKNNNSEIREIIDLNHLRPPYTLIPGQTVKLPKATFHIVGEKDTLYAIAQSYGVDESRLAQKNHLEPPFNLEKGQKLFLPSPAEKEPDNSNTVITQYDYGTNDTHVNSNAVVASDLAPLGSQKPKELPKTIEKNNDNDDSPFAIASGAALAPIETSSFNYKSEKKTAQATTPDTESKEIFAEPEIKTDTKPEPEIKELASPVKEAKEESPFTPPLASQPAKIDTSGKIYFSWPVKGEIISGFGPKQGGLYNDGINIAAKEGTPIKAAGDGDVVYAGNELRGYGNMLLIKHSNGFLTAYAHASDILVKKGDSVKKGQAIAYVGQTGHVSSPQLHFSIRQGRKAIDPEKHLPTDFSMLTK